MTADRVKRVGFEHFWHWLYKDFMDALVAAGVIEPASARRCRDSTEAVPEDQIRQLRRTSSDGCPAGEKGASVVRDLPIGSPRQGGAQHRGLQVIEAKILGHASDLRFGRGRLGRLRRRAHYRQRRRTAYGHIFALGQPPERRRGQLRRLLLKALDKEVAEGHGQGLQYGSAQSQATIETSPLQKLMRRRAARMRREAKGPGAGFTLRNAPACADEHTQRSEENSLLEFVRHVKSSNYTEQVTTVPAARRNTHTLSVHELELYNANSSAPSVDALAANVLLKPAVRVATPAPDAWFANDFLDELLFALGGDAEVKDDFVAFRKDIRQYLLNLSRSQELVNRDEFVQQVQNIISKSGLLSGSTVPARLNNLLVATSCAAGGVELTVKCTGSSPSKSLSCPCLLMTHAGVPMSDVQDIALSEQHLARLVVALLETREAGVAELTPGEGAPMNARDTELKLTSSEILSQKVDAAGAWLRNSAGNASLESRLRQRSAPFAARAGSTTSLEQSWLRSEQRFMPSLRATTGSTTTDLHPSLKSYSEALHDAMIIDTVLHDFFSKGVNPLSRRGKVLNHVEKLPYKSQVEA